MAGADPAEDLNCNHSPTTEDTVSLEKCQETSAELLLSEDETELPSDEYRPSNHENNETNNSGHARSYTTSDSQTQEDWYPFTSKIEMLCYIFMSSASHPVSEEIVKFLLFVLREAGVPDVPSLLKLKNLQFGNLNWEDMMTKGTDQNGIPFWILKPKELLKLFISNPKVSSKIVRIMESPSTIQGVPGAFGSYTYEIRLIHECADLEPGSWGPKPHPPPYPHPRKFKLFIHLE
uniref:Uncharacterized protein n=1 Tax=Magallana gigas TaxID=29159 RepID=K1QSH3_MAGGI